MSMSKLIKKLLESSINWERSEESDQLFYTTFQGKFVRLRFNDFPAELLCTIIIDGKETDLVDLVNFPPLWTLPPTDMRLSWRKLLAGWGVDPVRADKKFEEVSRFYAEPGRFYHTLDHVDYVLIMINFMTSRAKHLNAVKLAGWLHDVIYDSKAFDNEERSADYAQRLCKEFSIPDGTLIGSLILRTKAHDAPVSENEKRSREYAEKMCKEPFFPEGLKAIALHGRYFEADEDDDAQVLCDADLAILGEPESVYETYAQQIRQEYAWVAEPVYQEKRRRILGNFLARPQIYHILYQWEEPARRNLNAEITRLR